jgi:hypothetical protein
MHKDITRWDFLNGIEIVAGVRAINKQLNSVKITLKNPKRLVKQRHSKVRRKLVYPTIFHTHKKLINYEKNNKKLIHHILI